MSYVLVSGDSAGVGYATAKLLTQNQIKTIGFARSQTINGSWEHHSIDLANTDFHENLDKIYAAHGYPHTIILNAGIGEVASADAQPDSFTQKIFQVNTLSNIKIIKEILPKWRSKQNGHVICLGSIVNDLHFPFKAHYNASKAALTAFFLSTAKENQQFGIRTTLLEPGWIRSEFHQRQKSLSSEHPIFKKQLTPFLDHSNDDNTSYPNGESIAQIIFKEMHKDNYAKRITIGRDAKLGLLLKRISPKNLFEKFIYKLSKLP